MNYHHSHHHQSQPIECHLLATNPHHLLHSILWKFRNQMGRMRHRHLCLHSLDDLYMRILESTSTYRRILGRSHYHHIRRYHHPCTVCYCKGTGQEFVQVLRFQVQFHSNLDRGYHQFGHHRNLLLVSN